MLYDMSDIRQKKEKIEKFVVYISEKNESRWKTRQGFSTMTL